MLWTIDFYSKTHTSLRIRRGEKSCSKRRTHTGRALWRDKDVLFRYSIKPSTASSGVVIAFGGDKNRQIPLPRKLSKSKSRTNRLRPWGHAPVTIVFAPSPSPPRNYRTTQTPRIMKTPTAEAVRFRFSLTFSSFSIYIFTIAKEMDCAAYAVSLFRLYYYYYYFYFCVCHFENYGLFRVRLQRNARHTITMM